MCYCNSCIVNVTLLCSIDFVIVTLLYVIVIVAVSQCRCYVPLCYELSFWQCYFFLVIVTTSTSHCYVLSRVLVVLWQVLFVISLLLLAIVLWNVLSTVLFFCHCHFIIVSFFDMCSLSFQIAIVPFVILTFSKILPLWHYILGDDFRVRQTQEKLATSNLIKINNDCKVCLVVIGSKLSTEYIAFCSCYRTQWDDPLLLLIKTMN